MIVNVCPAAVTTVSPDRVWSLLTKPERFGEWQDAGFVAADPPGPIRKGQLIKLAAPFLGRQWRVAIEVGDIDPSSRWIDFTVRLPLGVVNQEHVTLTDTGTGGTLVRFN